MILLLTNAALCLSSTTSKDCTKFSGTLAPRPLIASSRIDTERPLINSSGMIDKEAEDALVVDVECDNGYLLVPANASPIHCSKKTGWDIPQCKGIYTWERERGVGGEGRGGEGRGGEGREILTTFCSVSMAAIPGVGFTSGNLSHPMEQPQLNIPVHLVGEFVRWFTVDVTISNQTPPSSKKKTGKKNEK